MPSCFEGSMGFPVRYGVIRKALLMDKKSAKSVLHMFQTANLFTNLK